MTTQPRLFDMPIPGVSHYGTPIPNPQQSPTPLADAVAMQERAAGILSPASALPVLPYGGEVPHNDTDTSWAAAKAMKVKAHTWQAKVLLVLDKHGPLSDETIERLLDCVATRTSRPRRRELARAGFVQDSDMRCESAISGLQVILWELTAKGAQLAVQLKEAEMAK